MNGKTDIDAILNPHSAEADRNTYGFRWLHFSTYGNRWLKLGVLGVVVDLYPEYRRKKFGRMHADKPVFMGRARNARILFTPIGSISWPWFGLLRR